MAISKIILNGVTQMDVTGKTVTASSMLNGVTALKNDGTDVTGNIANMTLPSSSSSTSSGTSKATITPTSSAQYLNIPTGYNATAQYYTIAAGGGGASNYVTGTFKGTTTGAAMEVTIPYTGTGYPIGLIIAPDEGTYNSSTGSFYSLVQRYATAFYMATKNRTEATPTYNGSSYTDTFGVYCRYKNSTSNSTSYTGTSTNAQGLLTDGNAKGEALTCVRLSSKTKMSVFIASTSYGFAANITYRYYIIYSS